MSKKPSFDEALRQKMNELPLPDENESWQKMKAMLDEKEKRRGFPFFRYEKIAAGVLLLGALLLWLASFLQTGTKSATDGITANQGNSDKKVSVPYQSIKPENNNEKTGVNEKRKSVQSDTTLSTSVASSSTLLTPSEAQSSSSNNKIFFTKKNTVTERKRNDKTGEKAFANQGKKSRINSKGIIRGDHSVLRKDDNKSAINTTDGILQKQFLSAGKDSVLTPNVISNVDTSSAIRNHQDKADMKTVFTKTDSVSANNTATKTSIKIKHRNAYFIDAGVGIKQQLPVGDQAFTSYNYNGNKSWLSDYISSLYIKLEKEKRWFVQGEFHFGAPRLVSKTTYWQKTRADYGHGSTTMDKYYLQKTWYNEVPLSFNLYLRPSLSAGAGVMYNMLCGASAKRETSVYDAVLNQSVYEEKILSWKGYTDSFLYKTNTSLLLQTDYHVDRWSFGLRYLQDVQPYLTYTLPDGVKKDKRNASLELLVRYRLFRSEKFRLGKW